MYVFACNLVVNIQPGYVTFLFTEAKGKKFSLDMKGSIKFVCQREKKTEPKTTFPYAKGPWTRNQATGRPELRQNSDCTLSSGCSTPLTDLPPFPHQITGSKSMTPGLAMHGTRIVLLRLLRHFRSKNDSVVTPKRIPIKTQSSSHETDSKEG